MLMSEQSNYENFTNDFPSDPMFNPDVDCVNSHPLETDSNGVFSYMHSQQTFGYQRQHYYPDVGSYDYSSIRANGSSDTNINTPNIGNASNYFYRANNNPHWGNAGVHPNAINTEPVNVNSYSNNNNNGASVNYTLPGRPVQMPFFPTFSNDTGTMPNTAYVIFVAQVD
ncbi:9622_t:CDS:1, partial [Paraglomus occultum]